jgi:hypothetical protein|nr:MAG TPA: hypothetical protein [Crassvirales sp.]
MEENKTKNNENKKLTYEQLNQAAQQISQQAEALYKENQQLKAALNRLSIQNGYTELGFKFKVVENSTMFPKEFVEKIITEIVDTMTGTNEEQEEEQETVEKDK